MDARILRKSLRTVLPRGPVVAELGQQLALEALDFTPQTVIKGYLNGFFPSPYKSHIHWQAPAQRAHIPVNDFHVSKNTKRLVRQKKFDIRFDTNFEEVIRQCANRPDTWISEEIINVYLQLHHMGVASSVEAWLDGELVGGLYGIRIGSYFAGESQFHTIPNAGKVALVTLCNTLKDNGFLLHDVQYLTPFLKQFGAIEVSSTEFRDMVTNSAICPAEWPSVEIQNANH